MKKLLIIALILLLSCSCNQHNGKLVDDENGNSTIDERITLFGYKFGSGIDEINPDKIITADSCLTYAEDPTLPMTIFSLENDQLKSIYHVYDANVLFWYLVEANILSEIETIAPNTEVSFTTEQIFYKNDDGNDIYINTVFLLDQETIFGEFNEFSFHIYNDNLHFLRGDNYCLIIKYAIY